MRASFSARSFALSTAFGVVLAGGASFEAARPAQAEARVVVDVSFFYSSLAPHGNWIRHSNHGWVWHPRHRARHWRPYTVGRWGYVDRWGWMWMSYEPWGWATYHYGRWYHDIHYGWVWVPGRTWGPAWVSWRECRDYVGWAPLPPGHYNRGRRHVDDWSFTRKRDFVSADVERSIIDRHRLPQVFDESRDITRLTGMDDPGVSRSVDRRAIEKALGRSVDPIRLSDATEPPAEGRGISADWSGRKVPVFRPAVEDRPGAPTPDRLGLVPGSGQSSDAPGRGREPSSPSGPGSPAWPDAPAPGASRGEEAAAPTRGGVPVAPTAPRVPEARPRGDSASVPSRLPMPWGSTGTEENAPRRLPMPYAAPGGSPDPSSSPRLPMPYATPRGREEAAPQRLPMPYGGPSRGESAVAPRPAPLPSRPAPSPRPERGYSAPPPTRSAPSAPAPGRFAPSSPSGADGGYIAPAPGRFAPSPPSGAGGGYTAPAPGRFAPSAPSPSRSAPSRPDRGYSSAAPEYSIAQSRPSSRLSSPPAPSPRPERGFSSPTPGRQAPSRGLGGPEPLRGDAVAPMRGDGASTMRGGSLPPLRGRGMGNTPRGPSSFR